MKKLVFLMLAGLLMAACAPKNGDKDSEFDLYKLNGKVRIVTYYYLQETQPDLFDYEDNELVDYKIEYMSYLAQKKQNIRPQYDEYDDEFYYYVNGYGDEGGEMDYTVSISKEVYNEDGDAIQNINYSELIDEWVDSVSSTYDDKHRVVHNESYNDQYGTEHPYSICDWQYDANDNVVYFNEKSYYEEEEGMGESSYSYRYTYNEKNQQTNYSNYDAQGKLSFWHNYYYDQNDNLVRDEWCSPQNNYSGVSSNEYKYNDKNLKIEEVFKINGKLNRKVIYDYDADGKETLRKSFDGEGNLLTTVSTRREGNTVTETTYEKEQRSESITKYNENQDILFYSYQSKYYSYAYSHKYDEKNRETDSWDYDFEKAIQTHNVTEYDDKGRITQMLTYKIFLGNFSEWNFSEQEELVKREIYTYDDHDNWISRATYHQTITGEETITDQTKREIVYF